MDNWRPHVPPSTAAFRNRRLLTKIRDGGVSRTSQSRLSRNSAQTPTESNQINYMEYYDYLKNPGTRSSSVHSYFAIKPVKLFSSRLVRSTLQHYDEQDEDNFIRNTYYQPIDHHILTINRYKNRINSLLEALSLNEFKTNSKS